MSPQPVQRPDQEGDGAQAHVDRRATLRLLGRAVGGMPRGRVGRPGLLLPRHRQPPPAPGYPRGDPAAFRPDRPPPTADRRGGCPPDFDREVYRQRNTVERCINRRKQWCSLATRTDILTIAYEVALHLAGILIWTRRWPERQNLVACSHGVDDGAGVLLRLPFTGTAVPSRSLPGDVWSGRCLAWRRCSGMGVVCSWGNSLALSVGAAPEGASGEAAGGVRDVEVGQLSQGGGRGVSGGGGSGVREGREAGQLAVGAGVLGVVGEAEGVGLVVSRVFLVGIVLAAAGVSCGDAAGGEAPWGIWMMMRETSGRSAGAAGCWMRKAVAVIRPLTAERRAIAAVRRESMEAPGAVYGGFRRVRR
ncbi:DDE family transposase [Streptomyces sp. PsTaAH-130]|nr:DDE family transposase [Streptomyces sp. PsTaAH-130]